MSNIEHGLVAPTITTLGKIAAKIGVDLPYLVTSPEQSKQVLPGKPRRIGVILSGGNMDPGLLAGLIGRYADLL